MKTGISDAQEKSVLAMTSANLDLSVSGRIGIKVAFSRCGYPNNRHPKEISKKDYDGMNLIKRLVIEDDGQGMVEYTLVVLMAALVFWVGVKSTNVGDHLAKGWVKILDCVTSPLSCSA